MDNQEEKPLLEECSFKFSQEANCLSDENDFEQIKIDYVSSLGLDRDDGQGFFVLKTKKWSLNSVDDLKELFQRIEKVMKND